MDTCRGALILHVADGMVDGCTDDDGDGCVGRECRHEASPRRCIDEHDGCNYCGIQ